MLEKRNRYDVTIQGRRSFSLFADISKIPILANHKDENRKVLSTHGENAVYMAKWLSTEGCLLSLTSPASTEELIYRKHITFKLSFVKYSYFSVLATCLHILETWIQKLQILNHWNLYPDRVSFSDLRNRKESVISRPALMGLVSIIKDIIVQYHYYIETLLL